MKAPERQLAKSQSAAGQAGVAPAAPVSVDALLAAMSDVVLVLDREGRYLWIAPTSPDLLYLPPEDTVGRRLHEIMPVEQADMFLERIKAALENQKPQTIEYPLEIEGKLFWFSAVVSPMSADAVVWVARDITERVMVNQRLEERVQGRTRELSALLDVSRALGSTLDLRPLLGVILDQLRTIVHYDGAGISLIEGDSARQIAARRPPGYPEMDPDEQRPVPLASFGMVWDLVSREQALIIDDILDDSDVARSYRATWGADQPPVEYARSYAVVPLVIRDEIIGALAMAHHQPGYFKQEHVEVVRTLAGQAAAAIANARLFEQTQSRTRELTALLEVSRAVASTLDTQALMGVILDQLGSIINHTGSAILTLVDGELEIVGARAVAGHEREIGVRIPLEPPTAMWKAIRSGEPVIIDDIRSDEPMALDYRNIITAAGLWELPPFQVMTSWMAVPLIQRDEVIGMLTVSHAAPAYFKPEHARLARAFADQAAIAIENARLFAQTDRGKRELDALLQTSHALASTLELKPLLERILEELQHFVDYAGASVNLLRDGMLRQLAVRRPRGPAVTSEDMARATPGSTFERVGVNIEAGELLLIDDVHGDSAEALLFRDMYGGTIEGTAVEYIHSFMNLPLLARGEVVGVLTVTHDQPGFFRAEHADLLRPLAAQAAIAIENARLFEERQNRASQLAALLEVSAAVGSTLELTPLLELIMDQLRTVVDYDGGALHLLENNTLTRLAFRTPGQTAGPSPEAPPAGTPSAYTLEQVGVLWKLLANGPVIIDDVRDDSPVSTAYRSVWGGNLEGTAVSYISSLLAAPLLLHNEIRGLLVLGHHEKGHFRSDHAELTSVVAAHAASAIENARLFTETQARVRETEALSRADAELFRSLDLDTVLQALVDVTVDIVGADKSLVSTLERAANRITIRAARNMSPQSLDRIAEYFDSQPLPERYPKVTIVQGVDDPLIQSIFQAESIHCSVDVPITSSSGELLGSFSVAYVDEHSFSPDELRLLDALAERAAVAISNAELYQRAQLAASLEERQRLARELHDSVSQALYGIALGARTARTLLDRKAEDAIEPIEYILSLADAGLTEMRALIFELRPESLETEGLVAAVSKQAAALQARYGLAVDCDLGAEPQAPLPIKEALYRITQEALNNTVKHAKATAASVALETNDRETAVTIRDNGAGFDPGGDFPGHLGLRSMKERAEKTGGVVSVVSAPGAGTLVRATFPLPAKPA